MKQKKGWKVFFLSLLMCLTFSSGAWAAEGDPVKIERVKLKLESQLTKTGEVKVTNMGKGYTVTGCEVINGADVDNWNSSYCARVQIGLVADSGYEFRKKGSSYFDLKGSDVYRFVSREYEGNEEVWLYVDMIPMNKKIGVPLDPDWSGTGTAKWSQAYKAVSYHVTLYENGKKRTSETVKRGNTIDFSGQMKEGKLYTFFVTAENSDGKKSKAVAGPGIVYTGTRFTSQDGGTPKDQAFSGAWIEEDKTGKWRYVMNARGTSWCQNQWKEIGGSWYRFDADGYMVTGWYQSPAGTWYYLDESGAMVTGERTIDGKTYRFGNGSDREAGVWIS